MRVVSYLNQFFAGLGGEELAQTPPRLITGAAGSARGLRIEISATIVCGDNYFGEHATEATGALVRMLEDDPPDVLVCGPAFGSGRYGFACGTLAAAASRIGIPTVTGMHPDNPGIRAAGNRPYIIPTSETAAGMGDALPKMARLAVRLAGGQPCSSDRDGYLDRSGVGRFTEEPAADRAVNLLLSKLEGRTDTEISPTPPERPAVAPLQDAGRAVIALITESACVPPGNPDGLPRHRADAWYRYPVGDGSLDGFTTAHGGFDTTAAADDPRRLVPADAAKSLEASGRIGRVHDVFFSTTGNSTPMPTAHRIGTEMARALIEDGVLAAILTST